MIITSYDNKNFERKSTIPHYKSFISNKRLYDVGSFELSLNTCELAEGDLILCDDFCGIVKRTIDAYYNVKVYGDDLKSLLSQRVFDSELTYNGQTAGAILTDIATLFLATGNRTIKGIVINDGSDVGNLVESYTFGKGGKVSDGLKAFCQKYEIGYDIVFDEKNIIFSVVEPRENTELIFDRRLHNIENLEYTKGTYDYVNTVYYTDSNENVQCDGNSVGIDRFEGYTESSEELLDYREEHGIEETLKGTPTNDHIYNVDYKIGDIVTVRFKNLETTKAITEIESVIELSKRIITPTFGTEKENPIKKIIKG